MQKIIFFDVDGTLLDSHFHMLPSTLETLKYLKQKGYLLCIATGRSYTSLLRTKITNIIDWDGIICNNGQLVLNQKQEVLQKKLLPKNSVKQFLEIARKLNYPVVVKCDKRFISQTADENTKTVHRHFNNLIPPIGTFTNQEVEAMNIYAPNGYDYHDFKNIKHINIIPCALNYAEVSPINTSKASAIKLLLDYYQLNDYMAFGDSPNDIEMLKHAKVAVVMGQSNELVKQYATYVTDSIDNDGIIKACKQLEL